MEKGEATHIDARFFDLEKTLDIDTMLHCRVRDALKEHWGSCMNEYDREHSLYLAHYWQQAIDSDRNAVLVPHDPRENMSGSFQGSDENWSSNEYLARQVAENYEEYVDAFKNSIVDQGLAEILDTKSLVVATNHQTYLNPAEIAHGLAAAFRDTHGIDIRKDTHIAIGPRITTHETTNGFYLPDLISTYCNWFLTVPATSRSQVPEADGIASQINKNALKQMVSIKRTPGQIIIIAPSGGRDTPEGHWAEEPSDSSYSLVSPNNHSALLPIAIADKGAENALSLSGGGTKIGVAIGELYEAENGDVKDKGYVKHIITHELYGELLEQAENNRL